jgi:hypothetical protein
MMPITIAAMMLPITERLLGVGVVLNYPTQP